MAGFTRRLFVVIGVSLSVLLLAPALAAVAQEQYPPSPTVGPTVGPTVEPANVTRTHSIEDPGHALAFTGSSDAIPMVWAAAGLVVFGGALVLVARRRRSVPDRA